MIIHTVNLKNLKTSLLNALTVLTLLLIPLLSIGQAPNLGASSSFALFTAAGAFTNNGASQVKGDIGTNVGAFTGFPPGTVIGAVHLADPITAQAADDLGTAYGTLSGLTCGEVIGTTLGGGQMLAPNIYCLGAASSLNGELILNGAGDPSSIFIFKIGGALSTSTLAKVTLTNGASLCNVFWVIDGAFNLGEGSSFEGTVLANGAINLLEGASFTGRGLSVSGAISLNNNIVDGSSPSPSTIASGGATTFCAGGSVVLSGNIGGIWSTGATTATITVSTSGDYFVTNSASCGSAQSNHIIVAVNPLSDCTISGSDVICAGQSTEICAPVGAASYLWNTGASTRCITVNTVGTYSITVTSASGCVSICSKILVDSPLPICAITGSAAICAGQTIQLCASGGSSYLWSTGASTSCIDVNTAGTYTVTVTTANGCSSTCSKIITENPAPICAITGATAICVGQTTQLCAHGGTSYMWSTGASTSCIDVNAAGTYSVTVTNANGCSSTCSQVVTVNPLPICTITGSAVICVGQSTQLCASGGTSYLWSTGASASCIDVNAAGTYTVTVTNANGCSSICSQVVTVNPVPICAITGVSAICMGQSTQLCANGGTSYLWSTGASTSCIDVNVTGTYSVTVTNASGCSSSCSQVVTVNPLPICLITGNDAICQAGQFSELCASGGTSYLWSTGASTSCITINAAGTYSVTVTNASGCISTCSKTITINPQPICTLAGNDAICAGQSTQLCATGGTSYLWSTGASTSCITINAAGTYGVTVTNADACISTCSKIITVNPLPICAISGNDAICAGQSTQLCASGGSSYLWSTGATSSCINVNSAGTYSVTVTDVNGCSSICSKVISGNPLPICTIIGSEAICFGQSTQLCASGGISYLWSTGAITSCIDVTAAGTYSVTVSDANGCSSTCSKIITVNPLPICLITGNDAICAGQSIELCASGGTSYLWSTGSSTSCINVNAAGTYSVTVTDVNGCMSTCSKIVSANPLPICTITGNDAICAGQSIQLCASGGSSYLWSTGATTSCINVNTAGTYSVTVTSEGGCISTCSKIISVSPLPICAIAVNAGACAGQSPQLCASGGSSYLWSTGASTRCINVNVSGTYTVTVTNANGCTSICSETITIDPQPVCLITGNDAICVGESTKFCASGGTSYLWSTGASKSCITVSAGGTYSVTVTNAAGCTSVCSKTIKVSQLASCLITGEDAICVGQSTRLCVPAGSKSYLWSTGATTNCITFNEVGDCSVTITNVTGCPSACSISTSRSQSSVCLITGEDAICEGQSTWLCVPTGAVSYLWSTGATTNCITVNAVGTYSVTVTEEEGCTSICSKTIKLGQETNCLITGYNTVCDGQSTQLCVPTGALGYLWSTGATTNCISVNAAGTYRVTVTYPGGCISTCSKKIKLDPAVSCVITGNSFICEGRIAQLCAPALADAYLWSNGATTRCLYVSLPGTYSVTVTYVGGCVSTCSKTITLNEETTCEITGNSLLCPGQTTQLCAAVDGAIDYWWSTGEQTQCINVTAPGTYSLTLTTEGGCMSFCSKIVTFSPASCEITGNSVICVGQSTELCVPTGALSYRWNTGATTNCITVNTAGSYSVTVTDTIGCTSECTKIVTLIETSTCLVIGEAIIRPGQGTQLCVSSGALKYLWSTGATTNCITVNEPGIYSVTVTHAGGCTSVCSKTITMVSGINNCIITGNAFICPGRLNQLCAPALAEAYLWSTGDTTRCIYVSSAGTYSVTVTSVGGIVRTCFKTIGVNEDATCEITGDTVLCQGKTTRLCAPEGAIDYWWSTGEQTRCIDVIAPGTYSLTLTTSGGCVSYCSKTVTRCRNLLNFSEKSIVEKGIQSDGNVLVRIYPNPLYAKTMIEFHNTDSDSHVLIYIYTSTGSKVATVFNSEVEKNVQYNTEWNAENQAGGVYYCRIVNGRQITYKKLILIKQ